MKLNISYPLTGCQKLIDIEDEKKVRFLYDKRISAIVTMESLGDEWKGYECQIRGGCDKQGFPMKQGVMTTGRVRLLLRKGQSGYHERRTGERKRKSVRGCIVDQFLSVISLIIIKKGEQEIPGLTDKNLPRRLGPKRATKIRKLFQLSKKDNVQDYVIKRHIVGKDGKVMKKVRPPKVQRLITPALIKHRNQIKKAAVRRKEKADAAKLEYTKLLAQRMREKRAKALSMRSSESSGKGGHRRRKRSVSRSSDAGEYSKEKKHIREYKSTTTSKKVKKPRKRTLSKSGGAAPAKPAHGKAGKPRARKTSAKSGGK